MIVYTILSEKVRRLRGMRKRGGLLITKGLISVLYGQIQEENVHRTGFLSVVTESWRRNQVGDPPKWVRRKHLRPVHSKTGWSNTLLYHTTTCRCKFFRCQNNVYMLRQGSLFFFGRSTLTEKEEDTSVTVQRMQSQ